MTDPGLVCKACGKTFPVAEGIPCLAVPDQSPAGLVTEANREYHDLVAGLFDPGGAARLRIRGILEKAGPGDGRGAFLDLAAGTGHLSETAGGIFRRAIGVDISFAMLKKMRSKGFAAVQADVSCLPFKDSSFRMAGAFSVFHHLRNPRRMVREVHRVLEPGGWFYSDWDPNPGFSKAFPVSRAFRALAKSSPLLFYPVLALLALLKRKRAAAVELRAYRSFLQAEYHANFGGGLDPGALKGLLEKTGFGKVRIFYHNNSPSLERRPSAPFLARLLNLNFGDLADPESGYYFAVLAQKKK
jgi:SAM-dependent methyltransferase